MSEHYEPFSDADAPIRKAMCLQCCALIPDTPNCRQEHLYFHQKVETALSNAQGYTSEGERYGWNA